MFCTPLRQRKMKSLSVIIPALNEERYIGDTLQWLQSAVLTWNTVQPDSSVEIVVVDNDSTDRTAELARSYDAKVISEPVRNISRARNSGARNAQGEAFLFLDADTKVPADLLKRIAEELQNDDCAGGAVAVQHLPASALLRIYVWCWKIFGRLLGMAQAAAQFSRRDMFEKLGGYDEGIYMGEDVDFFWRMKKDASRSGKTTSYIQDIRVVPSPRRWDQWPLWKTLIYTNPFFIAPLQRWKRAWHGWYKNVSR